MGKLLAIPLLALLLATVGCSSTTGPVNRDLAGTWVSEDFAPAIIRMTISEIALEVNGAGSWVTAQTALPFAVSGAHVEGRIALLFTFQYDLEVGFEGEFLDEDTLEGVLVGGAAEFRSEPITFVRLQDEE